MRLTSTSLHPVPDQPQRQRDYYRNTAPQYDARHGTAAEHQIALALLTGYVDHFDIASVLDVGCGTGRVLAHLSHARPGIEVLGVEPVSELREIAVDKGLKRSQIVDGSVYNLNRFRNQFDLVVAFGVMHHLPEPRRAIAEMLATTRRAVFISDCNNFGQGPPIARLGKRAINAVGSGSSPTSSTLAARAIGYPKATGSHIRTPSTTTCPTSSVSAQRST